MEQTPSVARCCTLCAILFMRWLPVVFIEALLIWSYYAYVFIVCFGGYVQSVPLQVVFTIVYNILFFLLQWSYLKCILTDHEEVPDEFSLSNDECIKLNGSAEERKQITEELVAKLPVHSRTRDRELRWCPICCIVKPDRCHHCSLCNRCIMKMDHHCPWVGNCVGFANYKYFFIFLFYSSLYTIYLTFAVLPFFIIAWNDKNSPISDKIQIIFLFIVAAAFGVSVTALCIYHAMLIANNRSTIEAYRPTMFDYGSDHNGFSLGYKANFEEVLGTNKWLWFLPVWTSIGTGWTYTLRRSGDYDIESVPCSAERLHLICPDSPKYCFESNTGQQEVINNASKDDANNSDSRFLS